MPGLARFFLLLSLVARFLPTAAQAKVVFYAATAKPGQPATAECLQQAAIPADRQVRLAVRLDLTRRVR